MIKILEFLGLGSLIAMMAFIPMTKMVMGGIITIIGAFFKPFPESKSPPKAKGKLFILGQKFIFEGGIRFLVVFAGIILLFGALLEGHDKMYADKRQLSVVDPPNKHDVEIYDVIDYFKGANKFADRSPVFTQMQASSISLAFIKPNISPDEVLSEKRRNAVTAWRIAQDSSTGSQINQAGSPKSDMDVVELLFGKSARIEEEKLSEKNGKRMDVLLGVYDEVYHGSSTVGGGRHPNQKGLCRNLIGIRTILVRFSQRTKLYTILQ